VTARPPLGSGRLSRRSLLKGAIGTAAGAAVAGGLSGCGSAFSAGLVGSELAPGTVTFWNLFGGGDGARLQIMLDAYADQQGGPDSLQAATEVTGAYGASVATVSEIVTPWRWFQTLYSQREGSTPWLAEGGEQLTYNEELTLDTLHWMQKLTTSGLMPTTTDYPGSQTLMFTGQSAFYLQGEWEITTAQSIEGLEFGMTTVPVMYDKPAQQADSHTFVLPKMERTDDQVLRAMGFIKSMLDQGMIWAEGGHIPTYLPTLNSAEFKALEPQSNYASAADTAVYDAEAWYSGSGSTFENIVGAQIGLVLQGLATPEEGLSAAHDLLTTYANTESPL
jgi:multiple sugar transport system substrate-binding protein